MSKMRLQPLGELTAPPDPLAGFKGPTSKGMGGQGRVGEREGKGMERSGRGKGRGNGEGKGKGDTGTCFSPLRALLGLCVGISHIHVQ